MGVFSGCSAFCGGVSLGRICSGLFSSSISTAATPRVLPQIQRRFLGNEARGPAFDPFDAKSWELRPHMGVVCRGIFRPALSYSEHKQFCESLRLVLFVGGSALFAADMLLFHPTNSAYWRLFSPLKLGGLVLGAFRGPKGTGGVFDFEQAGLTKGPDGTIKTAAYTVFEKM